MAQRVLAIFDNADEAVEAAAELRLAGPDSVVSLLSAEPIHSETEQITENRKSRIGTVAIAGGMLGATGAILFTVLTSRSMNLVTGGMPIVAPWALGIIVFEMTALGAILSTLGCMILEAGLVRPGLHEAADRAIAEGRVAVVIDVDDTDTSRKDAIQEVLARRGAAVL